MKSRGRKEEMEDIEEFRREEVEKRSSETAFRPLLVPSGPHCFSVGLNHGEDKPLSPCCCMLS